MANVTVRGTFRQLIPYLPDGVRALAEGLFQNLPRDIQIGDNLALYSAAAVHTAVEISDTAGSYPLILVAKSTGTACTVKLYLEDSGDTTVGTTDAVLSVGVSGTSGELSAALALGNGIKSLSEATNIDGLTIAAPATDVGTGAVANDPVVWVLYKAA